MNQKIELLEEILREPTSENNPVNVLKDIDNFKVLVWTFSKTGTSTLASSFQHSIDGTTQYKNVIHCHDEDGWFRNISPKLKEIDFTFNLLIEYINSKGIKPLIIHSYRPPFQRVLSEIYHLVSRTNRSLDSFHDDRFTNSLSVNYYKNTFKGIWTHDFDKQKGFGFHEGDTYDILYTTTDGINDLPENIKSIEQLKEYHNLKIQTKNRANNLIDYENIKSMVKWSEEKINKLYEIHAEPLNFFYNNHDITIMKKNELQLTTSKK